MTGGAPPTHHDPWVHGNVGGPRQSPVGLPAMAASPDVKTPRQVLQGVLLWIKERWHSAPPPDPEALKFEFYSSGTNHAVRTALSIRAGFHARAFGWPASAASAPADDRVAAAVLATKVRHGGWRARSRRAMCIGTNGRA